MAAKHAQIWFVLLLIAFVFPACGSGGDDGEVSTFNATGIAKVDDLVFENSSMLRGGQTGLDLTFSFGTAQVIGEDRSVVIALRLHEGINFANNSASLDTFTQDRSIDARVLPCLSGGGQLVIFTLGKEELIGASDPAGPASGKLHMILQAGFSVTGPIAVEARAGYDLVFAACDESFIGEETWIVSVLPG